MKLLRPAIDRRRIPQISLYGCQFKSIGKLRLLARLLEEMEVEFGIHDCEIELANCFVCHWITEEELEALAKEGPMQKTVVATVRGMRKKVEEYEAERRKKRKRK